MIQSSGNKIQVNGKIHIHADDSIKAGFSDPISERPADAFIRQTVTPYARIGSAQFGAEFFGPIRGPVAYQDNLKRTIQSGKIGHQRTGIGFNNIGLVENRNDNCTPVAHPASSLNSASCCLISARP